MFCLQHWRASMGWFIYKCFKDVLRLVSRQTKDIRWMATLKSWQFHLIIHSSDSSFPFTPRHFWPPRRQPNSDLSLKWNPLTWNIGKQTTIFNVQIKFKVDGQWAENRKPQTATRSVIGHSIYHVFCSSHKNIHELDQEDFHKNVPTIQLVLG